MKLEEPKHEFLVEQPAPPADPDLNLARRAGDRISAQGIALWGLGGFCVAFFISNSLKSLSVPGLLALYLGCAAIPMAVVSIFCNQTHLRPSSGLDGEKRLIDRSRIFIKLIGFFLTLIPLIFTYWIFALQEKGNYHGIWDFSVYLLIAMLLLAIPYIAWVDRRMKDPKDGYWYTGLLALGRWREINWVQIREHVMGWFIKGFFLPFMLGGAITHLSALSNRGLDFSSFGPLYYTLLNLIFSIDVVFGGLGYLLTLRILDSHIRNSQPSLLGWISAMICYAPFSTLILSTFLSYKGKTDWTDWLAPYPVLCVSWGFIILMLEVVYVWATCSFGCRFSNLTNRGIIVDGPYRYLKHPAYVSKNIAWWLISVPLVSHATLGEGLRACLCLGITNGIYIIRAWTEEKHLMSDPAYGVYCQWMNRHGLVAQIRRLFNRSK